MRNIKEGQLTLLEGPRGRFLEELVSETKTCLKNEKELDIPERENRLA